ncbi:MAG: rod shape-determining protein MreD [Coriobacteriales bacterium]|nr:rod shape-determining protein MreD [Coriobacteriales bacterium]
MNKAIFYTILIVLTSLFQLVLSGPITIVNACPNFFLISVVVISLYSGMLPGAITAFAFGLFYDFLYGGCIGCMALTFILVSLVVCLINRILNLQPVVNSAIVAITASFLTELIYAIASILTNSLSSGVFTTLLNYSLPSAIYSAVILFVLLFIIASLLKQTPSMASNTNEALRKHKSKVVKYK